MKRTIISIGILAILPVLAQAADSPETPLPVVDEYYLRDVNEFTKVCSVLDQARLMLKKDGTNVSILCLSEDGGKVGVERLADVYTVKIHQTKQMNGSVITSFTDSFNLKFYIGNTTNTPQFFLKGDTVTPETEKARYTCAEKIEEARASGKYGDMEIKFGQRFIVPTCEVAPAKSTNPVLESLKSFGRFMSAHQ